MLPNALRIRLNTGKILAWTVIAIITFIILFPLWWVLRTALTDSSLVFSEATSLLPPQATTIHFERVLGLTTQEESLAVGGSGATLNFLLYLRNSVITTSLSVFGQIFFGSMAAYAFARLEFPYKNIIFRMFISALLIPTIVTLIPNFVFIRSLGWMNTVQGIIAPKFLMTPFVVFYLRQFFLSVNRELEEAAKIDGAGYFTIFLRVVIPVAMGPIITLSLLVFVTEWNDYLWPLLVGREEEVRVLTVALGIFRQQTPNGLPDWTGLMAGAFVSILPAIVIFLFFGRKMVESIQFTQLK